MRAGRCLTKLGWTKRQQTIGGEPGDLVGRASGCEVLQHQWPKAATGGATPRSPLQYRASEVLQVEKPSDFRAEQYLQYLQYLLLRTRIKRWG